VGAAKTVLAKQSISRKRDCIRQCPVTTEL
jgi:hypothetical protein